MSEWWKETAAGIEMQIRVQPNASKSEIVGLHNGRLKVRIKQPAVDGGANRGLILFLSKQFGCAKSAIEIVRGGQIREKTLILHGVNRQALRAALPFFDL